MSENPWKEGGGGMPEIGVTLKAGKGYEAPWITVKGSDVDEVRRATAAVAGLDAGELPLTDVVHNVAKHFQSVSTVGTLLGATVVSEETPAQKPQEPAEQPNAAPAAQAPTLEDLIAQAGSAAELSDLFLKNKAAFTGNPALMDKLQERSKQV